MAVKARALLIKLRKTERHGCKSQEIVLKTQEHHKHARDFLIQQRKSVNMAVKSRDLAHTMNQGRLSARQGRLSTRQVRRSARQGQLSARQGRLSVRQGRPWARQGRISTRQVLLWARQGQRSARQGRLSARQGRLASYDCVSMHIHYARNELHSHLFV